MTYSNEGVYTVQLVASNKRGEDTVIKENIITVSEEAAGEQINLALNKSATASGYTASSESPDKALDGIINTYSNNVEKFIGDAGAKIVVTKALDGGDYRLKAVDTANYSNDSTFAMVNGDARIQVNSTPSAYYANSATVFVVADAGSDEDFTAYTGIKNAPSIDVSGATKSTEKAGVYYYCKTTNSKMVTVMFILPGAAVEVEDDSNNTIFLATDSVSNLIHDEDGDYFEFQSVVNGEIKTAKVADGVKIVKHGNRAASSKCGAADCLEALGLPLDLSPQAVAEIGDEVGITFAFAKVFHPAMRFVGPVRSALGVPCVFNVLGPLTNPANPNHVAIGCANRAVSPMMAEVYASRGQTGMVYTSHEGLDELAPTGPVSVWEIRDGKVHETEFDPTAELGLDPVTLDDLRGGEPAVNAQAMLDFLAGRPVPFRSTALLNAASAIVADARRLPDPDAALAQRFRDAYAMAEAAVDSGAANDLLRRWIEVARSKA